MEHLATLPPFLAQQLVEELHEAGVPAETTDTPPGVGGWLPGLGGSSLTVWLLRTEDLEAGRRILQSLQDVPKESEKCDSCGYDLRGHAGEKVCPECGEKVMAKFPAATWVTCEKCGEQSPPTANSCWKCAAPEVEEPARELVGLTPKQQRRANRIVFTIIIIAAFGMLITFFYKVATGRF